ncbi:MAG: HD domain-containing protein [Nitrosopumilus sp. H13]|nr:MAG: HD domain-containing protein [Nitrosopumilus sp. H13]
MMLDFFKAAANLKNTPRQGWVEKLGMSNSESVADHSYLVAVICMVFSDIGRHDSEKIIKMALLHDLAESITGDLTPGQTDRREKARAEDDAFARIVGMLPESARKQYVQIWKEYTEGKTAEAKMVHQIDKIEMALQARLYGEQGQPEEKLGAFFASAKDGIEDPGLASLLDEITGDR